MYVSFKTRIFYTYIIIWFPAQEMPNLKKKIIIQPNKKFPPNYFQTIYSTAPPY